LLCDASAAQTRIDAGLTVVLRRLRPTQDAAIAREWTHDHEKSPQCAGFFHVLAEWTGLEPATLGVTGRYSNQLNYHSTIHTRHVQYTEFGGC